ncbi:Metallo-dependent phosphatase-like protein [Chlamydoabsidia padenii]|nr:Metallo-dependent phosphatase-like protein [Chlamydoabsidia padenii]
MNELPSYYQVPSNRHRLFLRIGIAFAVVAVLVVAIVPAVVLTRKQQSTQGYGQAESKFSNLTRLVSLDLSNKQRIFVVGDVHGCANELAELVAKVQYNQSTDAMILAGDMVSKGPDNPGVIRLAKEKGMYCVRGNHDDYVIRFKTFENINGIQQMAPPKAYLPEGNVADPMKFKNEHAAIAVNLTRDDYDYLVQCPMVLDLPFMNARVVHGGVDPTIKNVTLNDPHTVFNIRDIVDGVPSRDNKQGTHWTDAYNEQQKNNTPPIKIYYGHDASRGLDLENVTFGLDSRCVYGGSLTAMDIKTHQYTQIQCQKYAT